MQVIRLLRKKLRKKMVARPSQAPTSRMFSGISFHSDKQRDHVGKARLAQSVVNVFPSNQGSQRASAVGDGSSDESMTFTDFAVEALNRSCKSAIQRSHNYRIIFWFYPLVQVPSRHPGKNSQLGEDSA